MREASERNQGYVVRSRLNRVPNKALKSNAFARKEHLRRFLRRYILSVKSSGLADMSDCSRCGIVMEETAEHTVYHCERVPLFLGPR